MNAALRKEVRLLLPAWIVALAAATVPVWVMGLDAQVLIFFAAGALLLSLSSFGLEMSYGTFPSLLAQPRPRLDTWQIKIGLLAVALALVVVAAAFSWLLRSTIFAEGHYVKFYIFEPLWNYVRYLLMLAVIAFAGGLWTTILFRQTVAAFWYAILVPLVLYGASWPLIKRLQEEDFSFYMAALAVVACVYAAGGYFLARWLFLRAQDKQAPEATNSATWSFLPTFATSRPPVPVAALLVKELRLQDGTLVIAAVLVLLQLAALAAQAYLPAAVASKYPFLGDVWMVWLVAPVLVGCASIAEERRGRTLESALCLPVGRISQFAIKLLVVFGLGILLGAVMPWLLEQLRLGQKLHHTLIADIGLPRLLLAAAIITAIGCYASSLSGSLLQALGTAIGLSVLSYLPPPFWLEHLSVLDHYDQLGILGLSRIIIFGRLVLPFFFAVFFFLSYANFEQLRITWRQWLRNGIILLAVKFGPPTLFLFVVEIPNLILYWKRWLW